MKLNNCRKAILSLSLLMFLGFGPFDWLQLITNYFLSQSDAVVEQTVPQNDGSGNGSATPGGQPSVVEPGQCPMCPGPRPRPRPIPPT
jgi:hypothetical protein